MSIPHRFTSKQMEGIWKVAHKEGQTTMKEFWTYARLMDWTFYDVLDLIYEEEA